MKELLSGALTLLGALIVSPLMFSIGILYSLCYSIWLSVTLKKWYAFFLFWWRLIDGLCAALGNLLLEVAFSLDLAWNVNGEILEDMITTEENTTFGQKNITVSASTGKIEIDGKLNKFGLKFTKALSLIFKQKKHAIDSWDFYQAKKKIREQYFK